MPEAAMLTASSVRGEVVQEGSRGRAGGRDPKSLHRGWLGIGQQPRSKIASGEKQRRKGRDATRLLLGKPAIFSKCTEWMPAPDIPNLAQDFIVNKAEMENKLLLALPNVTN